MICSTEGCNRPAVSKGLCNPHACKAWRAANIERVRQEAKADYVANQEAYKLADKTRYAASPERARQTNRAWEAANSDKLHEASLKRRAVKQQLLVDSVDPGVVFERDEGTCHLCLKTVDPLGWHLDHVIPLTLGGPHSYQNTAVSHPACNLSKHTTAVSSSLSRWQEAIRSYLDFHGQEFAAA